MTNNLLKHSISMCMIIPRITSLLSCCGSVSLGKCQLCIVGCMSYKRSVLQRVSATYLSPLLRAMPMSFSMPPASRKALAFSMFLVMTSWRAQQMAVMVSSDMLFPTPPPLLLLLPPGRRWTRSLMAYLPSGEQRDHRECERGELWLIGRWNRDRLRGWECTICIELRHVSASNGSDRTVWHFHYRAHRSLQTVTASHEINIISMIKYGNSPNSFLNGPIICDMIISEY